MTEELVKPSEWIKIVEFALKALFGEHVPSYIILAIGALLLVAILCAVVLAILIAAAKAKDIWIEKFRPLSYSPEELKRGRDSRLFANHVLREINQRNLSENWKDEEFAELEAEIEAQGQRRYLIPFRELFRVPIGIRREPSLTLALEHSSERLILLEGDPGAGKSVALRHVAQNIATRASKAKQSASVLPIFVNLKELRCEEHEAVDRDLIRNFILRSLNRINDRFIDEFLEAEFDQGLKNGRWVFLFDSFDEIPAVLSSTEADAVIQKYSESISDFLGGLNSCRGVVASRFYRGPSQAGWQRFRILELSAQRQQDLIDKALLSPAVATKLRGELALANNDIQSMAKNPMLLGLLCEHMRLGNDFPTLAYEVFEKYFNYRIQKDAERVMQRYGLDVREIQDETEQLAFAIASSPILGLSPSRHLLQRTLGQMGLGWGSERFNRLLDALEYMKIGRSDRDGVSADERQFTFSHRRFQEYFATCVVIRNSEAVTSRQLLLDARWRETAVVLCQTGRPEAINSLLEEAKTIVLNAGNEIRRNEQQPLPADVSRQEEQQTQFIWPEGVLHVLGILQAGFATSKSELPFELRKAAADVIVTATFHGSLLDRKFALEVAGVAPQETLVELIREALQLDSQWLNDVIYRQVARLSTIPPDVLEWVRTAILRIAMGRGAHRRRDALHAHLTRLYRSSDLLDALKLAYSIRIIDLVVVLALFVSLYMLPSVQAAAWFVGVAIFASFVAIHTLSWRLYNWPVLFIIATTARIYAFFLVAILVSGGIRDVPLIGQVLLMIGWLYLMMWPLAAIDCVKRGVSTKVVQWPLIPFRSLRRLQIFRYIIELFLSRSTVMMFCGYGAIALGWYLWGDTSYAAILVKLITWGMVVVFGLVILRVFGMFLVRTFKDYQLFSKFKRQNLQRVEPVEFFAHYKSFATGMFKFRFLNLVRSRGLLARSGDLPALQKFAAGIFDRDHSESVRTNVIKLLWRFSDFSISGYKLECRDEVYMLIEDLVRAGLSSQVARGVVIRTSDLDLSAGDEIRAVPPS
jgi:NACHT domain